MSIISKGKRYDSFADLVAEWKRQEKLWSWYKKLYYKWLRGPLWPPRMWYWLRCHTYNRYHILDVRSRDYRWGYCDPRSLITYACFKILCDFIEIEKPREQIETESPENEHWVKALNEMDALYKYWTQERMNDYEDRDQEMLKRLLDVREFMWT